VATIKAYECDACSNLVKKTIIVIAQCDEGYFSYKQTQKQPTLTIQLCESCMKDVGDLILNALR
jgi:hypothetical protein